MARTKKVVDTAKVETTQTIDNNTNNVDMGAILEQMKAMQAQIDKLTKEKEEVVNEKTSADALITALKKSLQEKDAIQAEDEDVPVMSCCVGTLTLSTDGKGMMTKYRFKELGEVQNIAYSDLKEICKNMRSFAEKGLFYILDEKVVKKLRLSGAYNKMASNEDIVHLFDKTPNEIIGVYTIATDDQKEVIVSMIQERLAEGNQVDYNVLAEIGKQCGKNLINMD